MTTTDADLTVTHHVHPDAEESLEAAGPDGNPALIGVPTFVVGSIALGLALVGYVPAAAAAACIPIILCATAIGQFIAAVWAVRLAQNAVASIFGIFGGFWFSYAALVLGLAHNWYGSPASDAVAVQKLFLLTWLIAVVALTLVSGRLPFAFSLLFVLIDIALLLVLLGTINANTSLSKAGGYVVFAFAALGVYLFADAMNAATGGKNLPLGKPVLT